MNLDLLNILRCPETGQELHLDGQPDLDGCIKNGWLVSSNNDNRYPIINNIPRFVQSSNYATNFGLQWNKFKKTQLDSHSGIPISSERFWHATSWTPEEIKGKWVLDVGCGAGRFAEIALKAGAKVLALDYSSAVNACYDNLKHHPNLHVVQGDIYALPLADNSFPFVYSLGVLQHTPNVKKAFLALPRVVQTNGKLAVDYYWKRFRTMLNSKYIVRPFTKNMDEQKLFELLETWVPRMLLLTNLFDKVPVLSKGLKRLVPVVDYSGDYDLSKEQIYEWALLDTFDMLAPAYDSPQTAKTVRTWFEEVRFSNIEVGHWSHLGARGKKND